MYWRGVVEGRLKGAILFAVSKRQSSLNGKYRPRKKKKHDLGLKILGFVVQEKIGTCGFREEGTEE